MYSEKVEFITALQPILSRIDEYDRAKKANNANFFKPDWAERQGELLKLWQEVASECDTFLSSTAALKSKNKVLRSFTSSVEVKPYLEKVIDFLQDEIGVTTQDFFVDDFTGTANEYCGVEVGVPPEVQETLEAKDSIDMFGACPHGKLGSESCYVCSVDTSREFGLPLYPRSKRLHDEPLSRKQRAILFNRLGIDVRPRKKGDSSV
jgi:hypothetical protein